MLSSVLDNQKQKASSDHSIELYLPKEAGENVQTPGEVEAAECSMVVYNLAETKYAFPAGESEIAVVSPDISQAS